MKIRENRSMINYQQSANHFHLIYRRNKSFIIRIAIFYLQYQSWISNVKHPKSFSSNIWNDSKNDWRGLIWNIWRTQICRSAISFKQILQLHDHGVYHTHSDQAHKSFCTRVTVAVFSLCVPRTTEILINRVTSFLQGIRASVHIVTANVLDNLFLMKFNHWKDGGKKKQIFTALI